MVCFDCEKCPFSEITTDEFQEIHITFTHNTNVNVLKDFGIKIIKIDLQNGQFQTMTSISIKGTRQSADDIVRNVVEIAYKHGLTIERVKLECSIFNSTFCGETGYFEGHFSVDTTREMVYLLNSIAESNDSHCSKNAFKEGVHMVTYRTRSDKAKFLLHMDTLESRLKENFNVKKRIHEFCYYDSNEKLDAKWINRFIQEN